MITHDRSCGSNACIFWWRVESHLKRDFVVFGVEGCRSAGGQIKSVEKETCMPGNVLLLLLLREWNHHYPLVAPRCDSSIAEENNALIFVVPTIQCILLRQIYLVYRNQADLRNEDLALWADCVLKTRSLKCISCLQPLLWCRECMNELLIALC